MAARETLDQLLEQKKMLEDRIQRRLASERKKKVNQILAIMGDFEITLADIEAGLKEKQNRPQYRNPQTGAKVNVPEKYVPHFKAGKELRERVDQAAK